MSKILDWKYLFRNAPFMYAQNLISAVSVLVVAVMAANFLEPDTYGNYKYIITLATFASAFSLTGIGPTLLRQTAIDKGASFVFLTKKLFLSLFFPAFLLFLGGCYYLIQGNELFGFSLLLTGLVTPLYYISQLYKPTLNGLQKYASHALFSSAHAVISAFFMVVAIYLTDNVAILVITFFISQTVIGLLFLRGTFLLFIKKTPQLKDTASSVFAGHLSLLNIFSKIANNIDSLIIFQLLGPAVLATYTFSKTPIDQFKAQNKTLAALIAPRFSKYNYNQIRVKIISKSLLLFTAGGLLALANYIASPYIFELFFPQYKNAVLYSQILGLGLLTFPQILYLEAFTALKLKRALYILRITSALLRISLIAVLTLWLGLLGLVSAIVLTQYLMLLLSTSIFHTNILNSILSSYKLNSLFQEQS